MNEINMKMKETGPKNMVPQHYEVYVVLNLYMSTVNTGINIYVELNLLNMYRQHCADF